MIIGSLSNNILIEYIVLLYDQPLFTPIGLRAIPDGCAISGGAFASGECAARKACYGASFARD